MVIITVLEIVQQVRITPLIKSSSTRVFILSDYVDVEFHVFGCRLTYQGQTVTSAYKHDSVLF